MQSLEHVGGGRPSQWHHYKIKLYRYRMRRSTHSILRAVNIALSEFNIHTLYAFYFSRGDLLVKRCKGLTWFK